MKKSKSTKGKFDRILFFKFLGSFWKLCIFKKDLSFTKYYKLHLFNMVFLKYIFLHISSKLKFDKNILISDYLNKSTPNIWKTWNVTELFKTEKSWTKLKSKYIFYLILNLQFYLQRSIL